MTNQSRQDVYDWLRGLASLGVVFGHLKPFPKEYVGWSVNFFMIITLALMAQSGRPLAFSKALRRLLYLAFVYTLAVFVFAGAFRAVGLKEQVSLIDLFVSPASVFIQNPYFGNLWYLAVYIQLVLFLVVLLPSLRRWSARVVLPAALVISQGVYLLTHVVLDRWHTIFLPAWFFVMAIGFYVVPPLLGWVARSDRHRYVRTAGALLLVVLGYGLADFPPGQGIAGEHTKLLYLPAFLATFYFFCELYFVLAASHYARWLCRGATSIGQYTLIIYITHMAFVQLLKPFWQPPKLVLAAVVVALSWSLAKMMHPLFLQTESMIRRGSLRGRRSPVGVEKP